MVSESTEITESVYSHGGTELSRLWPFRRYYMRMTFSVLSVLRGEKTPFHPRMHSPRMRSCSRSRTSPSVSPRDGRGGH